MASQDPMTRETVITQIEQLYRRFGDRDYGEACTQYEHMAQCGWWADHRGLGQSLAVAAFLHDLGHLIAEDQDLPGRDRLGYAQHDALGADWLRRRGFPAAIWEPIARHVQAKRYLVARRADYAAGLSAASRATLAQQGGPFEERACREFEDSPWFAVSIALREIDELGKAPEFRLPALEHWLKRIEACLEASG